MEVDGTCPPDLVVEKLKADDDTPKKGNPVKITYVIKNRGGSPAKNFGIAMDSFLGKGMVLDPSDNLNPGEERSINFTFPTPPPDDFSVTIIADYGNTVAESDEDNNTKTIKIRPHD